MEGRNFYAGNPPLGLTPTGRPKSVFVDKNQSLGKSWIPLDYKVDGENYHRMLAVNCGLQTAPKKDIKEPMMVKIEQLTQYRAYTVDMSAAHLPICAHYFTPDRGPNLYACNSNPDYWDELSEGLVKNNRCFDGLTGQDIRKACKVGILSVMNGGTARKPHNIRPSLEGKKGANGKDMISYLTDLNALIPQTPIHEELHLLCNGLFKPGSVYTVCSNQEVSPPKDKNAVETEGSKGSKGNHVLLSRLWASGEVLLLSHLIEAVYRSSQRLVPICLEHDGILMLAAPETTEEELILVRSNFHNMVRSRLNIYAEVSIDPCP